MSRYLLLALCIACLAGCSKEEAAVQSGARGANDSAPSQAHQFIAYEHSLELDTDAEHVAGAHRQAESLCEQAAAEQCVILASQLNGGGTPAATLKLRATEAGIRRIIDALSGTHRVVSQALTGEDLAGPISDSAKQLQLLSDYRNRLEALGNKTGANLEALMKLNLELAEVQGRIESLAGTRAHLERRVATRILNIEVTASNAISAWAPLGQAVAAFTGNLAQATSALVTLIALLLPWIVTALLMFWGIRRLKWPRHVGAIFNADSGKIAGRP